MIKRVIRIPSKFRDASTLYNLHSMMAFYITPWYNYLLQLQPHFPFHNSRRLHLGETLQKILFERQKKTFAPFFTSLIEFPSTHSERL